MKLDENIKKQIVRIRQEIRESKELKEKSTEKTVIGKQYPSLDKSEQDIRQTMTALSYIRECAVSDLFDDDDNLGDMDIDDNNFLKNM
jgi:fructose-1-phosphate kinase PfkB-like protein